MEKRLMATFILILVLVAGSLLPKPAYAGSLARPVLPSDQEQIAAIRQLNDTFLEVMGNYTDIRQEYLAEKQRDENGSLLPRVEGLYKKISSCRRMLFLMAVSPKHQQALSDAQQNSLYLANSIFEFYDALLTEGDDQHQQLANSAQDYEKALPYYTSLSAAAHSR